MDYRGRQQRLQDSLSVHRLDALLVTHPPNVRYLCGFTGSAGILVIAAKKRIFFTDGRYTEQARAEVQGAKIVVARKGPMAAAATWLAANRLSTQPKRRRGASPARVGIESEHMTVAAGSRLAGILPAGIRMREAPALIEQVRMVKDEDEIACLRSAVNLGSSLFDRALETIRPSVRETEVAAEMEYAARQAGAEAMSFDTIIASGARSALPHGRASQAAIPADGFVVCDFGVILAGYCSDMTRTVYVGRPSAEARGVYQAVQQAQQAAVDVVKPGIEAGEVDRAARKSLQNSGLAKYFTHSTGHGVGLEIHEAPRLAAGQSEVLKPGMVITIEPGVYVPGKWGVRIEDMVVVTERGCEVLTPTSKELVAI
jgi:Xaa-Pro aminopeptidase